MENADSQNVVSRKWGLSVLAIPSRLFYAFERAVDGYHHQRESSDLSAEAKLLENSEFANQIGQYGKPVHLIDIGGGDGLRAKCIAQYLQQSGLRVSYTCYDGSDVMMQKNRETFQPLGMNWNGISGKVSRIFRFTPD